MISVLLRRLIAAYKSIQLDAADLIATFPMVNSSVLSLLYRVKKIEKKIKLSYRSMKSH
jgi:hypothetical protein